MIIVRIGLCVTLANGQTRLATSQSTAIRFHTDTFEEDTSRRAHRLRTLIAKRHKTSAVGVSTVDSEDLELGGVNVVVQPLEQEISAGKDVIR